MRNGTFQRVLPGKHAPGWVEEAKHVGIAAAFTPEPPMVLQLGAGVRFHCLVLHCLPESFAQGAGLDIQHPEVVTVDMDSRAIGG